MMKLIAQVMLTLFLVGGLTYGKDKQVEQPPQQVLQQATIFGFGVKKGQPPNARATDTAYRALMAQEDAKQQFSQVFEKGNLHGKCYALSALHGLDKKLYTKLAATMDPKAKVRVRDGCCYSDSTVKEILEFIQAGRYSFMDKPL